MKPTNTKPPSQPPQGVKQEPTLGKLEVRGGKAEAIKRQADKIAEVCAEVYRLTGQKVTADDPILLAALFQSELMHKAGADVAAVFEQTVAKAIAMLADAVKEEREQAANLDKSVAQAFQQIADGAKKVGDGELATMQARFARAAAETLDNVRQQAQRAAPGGLWWKLSVGASFGALLGVVGGVYVGRSLALQFTDEQSRLIHNGMLLDDAWPKLSKSARESFGVVPKSAKPAQASAGDKAGK